MNQSLENKIKKKEESFRIFDTIHKRYDLINHLLSFGRDYKWRRIMAKSIEKNRNQKLLDLATGTGDVAFRVLQQRPEIIQAYGCDKASNMLELAQKKAIKKKLNHRISFLTGDAEKIPFKDETFDIVTIAFGIRNMQDPLKVLGEMFQVLKKGGKVFILEFSLPGNRLLRKCHLFYLRNIMPIVGGLLSGDADAYRYLNKTIESFPYGESFGRMMMDAGFVKVNIKPLTFGVVNLYQGVK